MKEVKRKRSRRRRSGRRRGREREGEGKGGESEPCIKFVTEISGIWHFTLSPAIQRLNCLHLAWTWHHLFQFSHVHGILRAH